MGRVAFTPCGAQGGRLTMLCEWSQSLPPLPPTARVPGPRSHARRWYVIRLDSANTNDACVHNMLQEVCNRPLGAAPDPRYIGLDRAVRAVTAMRDQHRAQGADANRTGIRNYNLADPMSPRSTYRGVNGSLSCIYLVFSLPTEGHPPLFYVGQALWHPRTLVLGYRQHQKELQTRRLRSPPSQAQLIQALPRLAAN
jgi:hypothetical protein